MYNTHNLTHAKHTRNTCTHNTTLHKNNIHVLCTQPCAYTQHTHNPRHTQSYTHNLHNLTHIHNVCSLQPYKYTNIHTYAYRAIVNRSTNPTLADTRLLGIQRGTSLRWVACVLITQSNETHLRFLINQSVLHAQTKPIPLFLCLFYRIFKRLFFTIAMPMTRLFCMRKTKD